MADTLDRRRAAISAIVERHRGSLARADPDRQIAYWGWPIAQDHDVRLAIMAALEMVAVLDGPARCGIDTGITVTQDGDAVQTGIGIVGEVVLNAMRLQGSAQYGTIVVSDITRRLVDGAFELKAQWVAAGRSGDIPSAWRVLRPSCPSRRVREVASNALIAREHELDALLERWRSSLKGSSQIVHVWGAAGIGKSALLGAFRQCVMAQGHRWYDVRCLPEQRSVPLAPIQHLLAAMRTFGNEPTALAADGDASPGQATQALTPVGLLDVCAAQAPMVLAIEDLHWADLQTIDYLRQMGRRLHQIDQVLVVTVGRDLICHRTADPPCAKALELDRLSAADLDLLLEQSAPGRRLSADQRRLICNQADGVPLYALELARLCADGREPEAHRRLLSQANRINGTLASRLDSLGRLKPLAQVAAVAGREFDSRLLAATLNIDEKVLIDHLDMLADLSILTRRKANSEGHYRFRQAIFWSAALASLTRARRRHLHARVAAVLLQSYQHLTESAPWVVALHLKRAGDHRSAFHWWYRAALLEADTGSPAQVISHIKEALAAAHRSPNQCTPLQEVELLRLMGVQLAKLHGSTAAQTVAVYEHALNLISATPARPETLNFEIRWALTVIHLVKGHVREALAASAELVARARKLETNVELLAALRMLGAAQVLSGRLAEGIETLKAAIGLYHVDMHGQLRNRFVSDQGANALAHLASALALSGDLVGSQNMQRQALRLAARLKHPYTSANVLGVLATAALHRSDQGTALALAHAGRALCATHNYAYWGTRAALVLAWQQGIRDPAAGLQRIEQVAARYRSTGSGRASVLVHSLVADMALRAGDPRRALRVIATVKTAGERHGEWLYIPQLMRIEALARLEIDGSNHAAVVALLKQAHAITLQHGSDIFARRIAQTLALVQGMARDA